MLCSECLADLSCTCWINKYDSSKSLKPYHLAARWIPIAVGPFININASIYAGTARLNNSELPYVDLTIYDSHEIEWEHNSAGTGEEDVANFDKINAVCPGLKEVLKAFNSDENLLKCFANYVSSYFLLRICTEALFSYLLLQIALVQTTPIPVERPLQHISFLPIIRTRKRWRRRATVVGTTPIRPVYFVP